MLPYPDVLCLEMWTHASCMWLLIVLCVDQRLRSLSYNVTLIKVPNENICCCKYNEALFIPLPFIIKIFWSFCHLISALFVVLSIFFAFICQLLGGANVCFITASTLILWLVYLLLSVCICMFTHFLKIYIFG